MPKIHVNVQSKEEKSRFKCVSVHIYFKIVDEELGFLAITTYRYCGLSNVLNFKRKTNHLCISTIPFEVVQLAVVIINDLAEIFTKK